ncbi:HAD-IA family hydrolase [Henriciella algicola]|uniref:HAD family hydrolase n=1 Tax=Henriciella algicola TaxID=1608422 RepID=A0A399RMI8_9PROT|nr:HAD-IA family hydrolase [Henriciella algicola]RIJ30915.1 HAD family hydrolase [Henriciella algicola]
MTQLKLAIWDMDGTIVDSREVIQAAMCRAFGVCGLPEPAYEETRKIVGLGLEEACRILAPDYHDPAGLSTAYKEAFVARRTEENFVEPLYDGAEETLKRLAEDGWLIAMATGKSHRGIRAIFEMHPLEQYFDTIWCADDGPGKPHPFMVEQCMNALGCEPHQSLIIGDAIHDIAMGRNAGIHTMGVSWGFGRADELHAAGAHEVHDTFASLNAGLLGFEQKISSI